MIIIIYLHNASKIKIKSFNKIKSFFLQKFNGSIGTYTIRNVKQSTQFKDTLLLVTEYKELFCKQAMKYLSNKGSN